MIQIPTNARTAIRITAPEGVEVKPWTIEFKPSDPDLVRLYSVDDDPHVILVETTNRSGTLTLACHLGLHGTAPGAAGALELKIDWDAPAQSGEIVFDLR